MNKLKSLYLIFTLLVAQTAWAYGLKFYDSSYPIMKRTSFDVFDGSGPLFRDSVSVSFRMAIYPSVEAGYVLRVRTGDGNSSGIYNLFCDRWGDSYRFRVNHEGHNVLIDMSLNQAEVTKEHWFPVKLTFNLLGREVILSVNNQVMKCRVEQLPHELCPEIVFGKSDYIIDVPSIAIDNLVINGMPAYSFPLDESRGDVVHNTVGTACGKVTNPVWLINDAYHWNKVAEFSSESNAGTCYDARHNKIYYFNRDSIMIYDAATGAKQQQAFGERCPVPLFLANTFVDDINNRLYVYEVFHDFSNSGPTIASLDLDDFSWRVESESELVWQLHHHDAFCDPVDNMHAIFGGFGNMHFSNTLYRYDFDCKNWVRVDSLKGDVIAPRYFVAAGYLDSNRSAYIFGGMGNESGEQIVGRRYFYDLHRIDLNTRTVEKLWELQEKGLNTAPARGMLVTDDSTFYVLRYPESVSDSYLKLYRFSIKDGANEVLGDSIPIKSDKITTNAHLYYNERAGRIYVTVQESDNDVRSTLKIYSLSFPPVSFSRFSGAGSHSYIYIWVIVVLVAVVAFVAAIWLMKRRRKSPPLYNLLIYTLVAIWQRSLPVKSLREPIVYTSLAILRYIIVISVT